MKVESLTSCGMDYTASIVIDCFNNYPKEIYLLDKPIGVHPKIQMQKGQLAMVQQTTRQNKTTVHSNTTKIYN